ncbi:MAG: 50S ribosomal protein L30 [Bacillota bacterium]|jgi:large subunit ribosomal protein L30|nr:50S ribosomal protein L30 [Bacillota bacterium]HOB91638.1 50S ribosomal protein L30 [Bacillota bacterium]HPZ54444.1 50S ribosomal protein L30 [Bacillota bacterium]HQD17780.1 50S ribosomal protein L30 [Bacillota bacterium]
MASSNDGRKLKVTLVKSGIGYSRRQKRTIEALGFKKLGQVRIMEDNPAIRGMISKVSHLLNVEEV